MTTELSIDNENIYFHFNNLSHDDTWKCPNSSYKSTWDDAHFLNEIWEVVKQWMKGNSEIPKNIHSLTIIQIYNLLPDHLKDDKWIDYLSIYLIVESIYTDNERLQKKNNCMYFIKLIKTLAKDKFPDLYIAKDIYTDQYVSLLYKKQIEILKYFDYKSLY